MIFVPDVNYRATLTQIQGHPIFRKIDWDQAKDKQMKPPFVPTETQSYHNCCDTNPNIEKAPPELASPRRENPPPKAENSQQQISIQDSSIQKQDTIPVDKN